MVKKTCKEIEDIWLLAYACKGKRENSKELYRLNLFEKKILFIL